jgi:UDP-glucose 4-epimerase
MNMKILVTGGAGFIGSHLSDKLVAEGHEVTVIDDLSTGSIHNLQQVSGAKNFRLVVDDMLNAQTLSPLVQETDLIYHLAAAVGVKLIVNQPVRTIETNIRGSERLFSFANKWRKPVVFASTSEIYGKNDKVPFKEEDDMVFGPTSRSRWSYGCSKAIDEFLGLSYFRETNLPVILVRLFNTVGPRQSGQYGMVIPTFVEQALKNEPITVYGDGEQSRSFGHVHDVIRALIDLPRYHQAWGEVFNLGNPQEIKIIDLAKRIKEFCESNSEIRFLSYDDAYEAGFEDMKRRVPDISKIERFIGFQPEINTDQIIRDVIEYKRAQRG